MASTASTSDSQSHIEVSNAFEEIAPPSASTSATFSTPLQEMPWDIFINHRGPDVKDTLARAIYNALHAMGLRVFLDSEDLHLGDFFPAALEEAMRSASIHIAIFSPGYAQSSWCLAELSFMLKSGAPIIPVFFHVQPTDLRWVAQGKGKYVNAFLDYAKKGRYSLEKVQEWKTALYNASFYKGEIISNKDEEQRVLKNIVNRASKVMKIVPLEVAKYAVGLEEVVADFDLTLRESAKAHSNVQIVGIWGMSGSGKTTLAKELYNQKCSSVRKSSFLFDVRDAAIKNKLHKKQMKLLQDLGFQDKSFGSIEQGKMILSNYLKDVRVLIILDDISHVDQLDTLLPAKDILGWGSLIIVTTQEREVLKCWGISCIYKMKTMNPFHAKQLFCWHAFFQASALPGFEELVDMFVSVCDGLPLSLKVIGSQLDGCYTKDYWDGLLKKISRILPTDIRNRLRVSYDALDEEEKQTFLDVACFFIGQDKMTAIAVWDGSGLSGLYSWERLVNKCLVDLDDNNGIRMNDQLRDLAREIAKSQPPYRVWSPDQITGIQKHAEVRGMILNEATSGMTHKFPPGLHGLKVFVAGKNYGSNLHIVKLSRELAWLSCSGITNKNLPSWLPLKNLRVLELYNCQNIVGLWKDGAEVPLQLRVLMIVGCCNLAKIPKSIGYLENLKEITLFDCKLESLPNQFCRLQSLEHLQLISCKMLSSLPSRFGHLTNLRHLDLSFSYQSETLPDSFKQLKLLQYLNLMECKMLTLKSDILENMTKLEYLNLNRCIQLEELPCHITNQASLNYLYLLGTWISKLPNNIGQLSRLKVLEIFPDTRDIEKQSLPDSLGSLNLLEKLRLANLEVESLPKSLNQLFNLQNLQIIDCPISELDLGRGPSPSSLCNLKTLDVSFTKLSKISISEDCCPGLKLLSLWSIDYLTEVEELPTALEDLYVGRCRLLRSISGNGDLVNLHELRIENCPSLNALPSFHKLASLEIFDLIGGNEVDRIQGLEHCTSLGKLNCTCLELLHMESLEHQQGLRSLELVTKKRLAIEPCIQTIQRWPDQIIICTKAVPDAGSLLTNSVFPNVSYLRSFANKKIRHMSIDPPLVRLSQKHSSNANAFMLYIFPRTFSTELSEGKWIWMGVFTQRSRCLTEQNLFISNFFSEWQWFDLKMRRLPGSYNDNNEIEKGFIVRGEERIVIEAFHRSLALLGE
ncbi:hypothetical protein SUGI_0713770 [Cryptomeria japonica]|nr:hypothetical protein SUGI_0713770 [Cryptomeria japonica]